jgi:arylsulfatase A
MNRREFLQLMGASALFAALGAASEKRPPNVLLVVVDDLGWRDLGCYGSDFYETPNIDFLAAHGVRFTQFYAASPVCSPTRASILSGQYPARLHLTHYIPGGNPKDRPLLEPDWRKFLPLEEFTLAEAFQAAGYATGCIGKWHLGITIDPKYGPANQGFDFTRLHGPSGGDKFVSTFTDTALDFVDNHKSHPFFLYFPHHTVHVPYEAPENIVEKYRRKKPGESGQNNAMMAAMIEVLDQGVGRLMRGLQQLGVADNTIVVFTSDNGGLRYVRDEATGKVVTATNNAPLRGGKAQLYEGGIRIPFIVRWPGVLDGGRQIAAPAIANDIFPSLLAMTGLPLRPEAHKDGIDILAPFVEGKTQGNAATGREALFWHFPHYHAGTKPCGAVRRGSLKLIEHYEDGAVELYDLEKDLGETHDLAMERPDTARELRDLLHRHLNDVGAQMLAPNPASASASASHSANRAYSSSKR